jgi:lipopolysaccharide/colanic/teichoic acid biosynthesis glycosyltransferase/protein involved in polysaccharide export with SLBB domain
MTNVPNELQNLNPRPKFDAWHMTQRLLAMLLLIAMAPLLMILCLLVKADSRGPFIYVQERPGRFGKPFKAYKIRSMTVGADRNPKLAHAVTSDTPEVTRAGRYLRDLKLDELPQLWNIVRGEMAFVGPRPIAPSLQQHLEKYIPGFQQRLLVLPGMTSLGQICIEENEAAENVVADWAVRFEGEQHYILHRNVAYDLTIMLLTAGYCLRKVVRRLPVRAHQAALVMLSVSMVGCSSNLPPITRDGYTPMAFVPTSIGSPTVAVETVSVESLPLGADDPVYRLGPGDRVFINVFGEPNLDAIRVQVAGSGDVQLPILGRVEINDLSLNEVQELLEHEYGKHFIDPWVVVQLDESLSRPVYLLGAFNKAGVIQMERPTSLIQALSEGEGLTESAYVRGARLIRGGQIAAVDIHGLLNSGRMNQNVWLQPEDTIFVPGIQDLRIYMLGAVIHPGAKPVTNGPLTLAQAMADAGGPLPAQANLKHIRVIRARSPVAGELYVIDYTRIITGESFDMPLEPGDIVYVPPNGIGSWNDVVAAITPTIEVFSLALDPFVLAKAIQD